MNRVAVILELQRLLWILHKGAGWVYPLTREDLIGHGRVLFTWLQLDDITR